MKLLMVICGVLASLALVGIATGQNKDAAKTDAVKEEMKKMEGTWTLEWFEQGGEKTAARKFKQPIEVFGFNASTIIKDGKSTMTFEGKTEKYSCTVDPTKKPKTLDRVVAEGKSKGQTYRYLYELEGNALRLCYNAEMSDVRPKTFKSEGTITILTFERKKP
jgi:uncharacterized protein (TIGR03067 family)